MTQAAYLLAAVYELTHAKPQEKRAQGYTTVEWPIYAEGYMHALVIVLGVLELAADRYALRQRTRRQLMREARQKVGAA